MGSLKTLGILGLFIALWASAYAGDDDDTVTPPPDEPVDNGDVLTFTDADFDEKVKEHEIVLVKFYAPWCGHCKKLAPEFKKAASELKWNDPPVALAETDCTVEKKQCEKYGVKGFPTLKIFRNGELSQDYKGPRDADGIVSYMRNQANPAAKELNSVEEFEKFIDSEELSVVGFFESESKLKASFLKVADAQRDMFTFGISSVDAVLKKAGFKDNIVAYQPKHLQNKFDPKMVKYDGSDDTDKIKDFLVNKTVGLAGIRTYTNMFQFSQKPLFIVYFNVDYKLDPKGTTYWRNRVLKVAADYKQKAHFAISKRKEFEHEITENGLGSRNESDKPLVAALTKDGKFPMEKEFSIENLKKFVDDVLGKKLEPYVKSEPEPETQGDVKVVVAKSFKKMVLDADTDVLIEFYAPWCGHCKQLAPKYDKLGKKMAKENVIIAKMDATANDVPPPFEVRGFPTLYWVPKNAKDKPVRYEGGREVKDFIKYIAEHSTDGLKNYGRDGKKKKKTEL